jgi:hypothetical protein
MNNLINATKQLELGFNQARRPAPARQPATGRERAAWWFARMRATVDSAMAWQPAPPPRPEQAWFAHS